MVRKGLSRLDGVLSVSEEAANATRTCTVRTRDGRLLFPALVAAELKRLQVGASLRAMEVTVDGSVQREGKNLFLRIPGELHPLPLVRFTKHVAWDDQKNRPRLRASHERAAWSILSARAATGNFPVRITGPLRQLPESDRLQLEVRTFELYPESVVHRLQLFAALRVDSPYGLGDRWTSLQQQLGRIDWIQSAERLLIDRRDTLVLTIRPGFFPNIPELGNVISASGLGIQLSTLELTGQSLASAQKSFVTVKVSGIPESYQELKIKPALPKSRWNELRELLPLHRALSISWRGRLDNTTPGAPRLLLKTWELPADSSERQLADVSAPPSPPLLQARTRDGRTVEFEWFDKSESPGAYNIYRQAPDGSWHKINDQPLTTRSWHANAPLTFLYAVTALTDHRESTYSRPVSPAPPAAPSELKLRRHSGVRHLTWKSSAEPDFASYNIYRSRAPSGPYTQIAAGVTKPAYTDTLASRTPFYYVVTATDSSGNQSTFSREVASRLPPFTLLRPRK